MKNYIFTLLLVGLTACTTTTHNEVRNDAPYTFQLLAVDEARAMNVEKMSQKDAEAVGDIILTSKYDEKQKYLLKSKSIIDNSMIVDAELFTDESRHGNMIDIQFSKEGGRTYF